MIYKRGINNIEQFKNISFYMSSNKSAYSSLGAILDIKKPYNGIYIRNSKIYVSNVFEKIETASRAYYIADFTTLTKQLSSENFLVSADLNNNFFEYVCDDVSYNKKLGFITGTDVLCIEYNIQNNSRNKAVFKTVPHLTYRDMMNMKKSNVLKFNKRNIESGILVNLSVMDNENIIIKSDFASFNEIDSYMTNIKHEFIDTNLTKEMFIEDLYIPGEFVIKIKPGADMTFRVYLSHKEFDLSEYISKDINELFKRNEEDNIKAEYVELKKLSKAINAFELDEITASLPSNINVKKIISELEPSSLEKLAIELNNIVKAIDGQYLVFGKLNFATHKIEAIIECVNYLDKKVNINTLEFLKLRLWIVELINKIAQKNQGIGEISKEFLKSTIKNLRHDMLENTYNYFNYIEIITLAYNAFKVHENVLDDSIYFEISKDIKDTMANSFWDDEHKVLKYNLEEESVYATPEMIYSLSLSYQSVDGMIPIKLLDTIFKELYTPYGLREVSKNSSKYKGIIYPKYMAHFVKANLKQNGVTFASQKISYNLVKELLLEIGKHTINSVKSVYHEKGITVDSSSLDLLTTAEMIRLYDMLT